MLSDVDPAWACSLREAQVAAYRQARQKVVESKLEYFQCAPRMHTWQCRHAWSFVVNGGWSYLAHKVCWSRSRAYATYTLILLPEI